MAQTIPNVNEVASGTVVGRVEYLGGTETRFVPREGVADEPDEADEADAADPDVCRALLRELTNTLESAFDRDDPPIEEVISTLDVAESSGCLDADAAERFRNRVRGLADTRFQAMSARKTAEELPGFFDLPPRPTTFSITGPEGETRLELTEGDAIEVEFINVHSRRRDTVQGVIEDIRSGVDAESTWITLTGDVDFRPTSGASVRINDRRRGLFPRDELVTDNIRTLFGDGNGGEPADVVATVTEAVTERADALEAGDRRDGEPVDRCEELGPYIFAAIEPLEREPPSPFADGVDDLAAALDRLAREAASFMRRGKCGGSDGQGAVRRTLDALAEAVTSNKPATIEAVQDFREAFVEAAIPPTWTYRELAEQIGNITRRDHQGSTTPAAALLIVGDVANWLRFIPLAAPPGAPHDVVAAARQKVDDQWPDVRGWTAIERDPDFEFRDFQAVWEGALEQLVAGEFEAAIPALLNLRRGTREFMGPATGREHPLDFEFPDDRGEGEASTALRGGGEFEPPGRVGEWELVDESPITWRREGFHLTPPAAVPRPEQVLAQEFETLVLVRQSQNRHHVDIRWAWDGETETSRRADVTVGDTRTKAIELAVEILEANDRHPR